MGAGFKSTMSRAEDRAWRKTFTRGNRLGEKKLLYDLRHRSAADIVQEQKRNSEAKSKKDTDARAEEYYQCLKYHAKTKWRTKPLDNATDLFKDLVEKYLQKIPLVILSFACFFRIAEKKTGKYFLHEKVARFSTDYTWDMETGRKFSVRYHVS